MSDEEDFRFVCDRCGCEISGKWPVGCKLEANCPNCQIRMRLEAPFRELLRKLRADLSEGKRLIPEFAATLAEVIECIDKRKPADIGKLAVVVAAAKKWSEKQK